MALIAIFIGIALLLFYVWVLPKLDPEVRNQIYYVVLFPFAIACAVTLFGAMRSYARLTAKHPGIVLELGGPVVLFLLIIWGGFKIVLPLPDSFDLTVRAHSADGSVPVITSGNVTLELDNNRPVKPFGPNGEAEFKGIPAKFLGATIRILPQVDGYEEKWLEHKIEFKSRALEVPLERVRPQPVSFHGFVQDEQGNPIPGVKVMSPDCSKQAVTGDDGTFAFQIQAARASRCHLVFSEDGYQPYNTDVTIDEASSNRFLLRKIK
jgi:hypothetical protein